MLGYIGNLKTKAVECQGRMQNWERFFDVKRIYELVLEFGSMNCCWNSTLDLTICEPDTSENGR